MWRDVARGREEKQEIDIPDRDEGGMRDKEGDNGSLSTEGTTERCFGLDG